MALRRVIISEEFGVFHVGPRGAGVTAETLEKALGKAVPLAPDEAIHYAAEVIESLLAQDTREREL